MSNVGLLGFPPFGDPRVDPGKPLVVGPRHREPTTRINWPVGNILTGSSLLSNAEPMLWEYSNPGAAISAEEWVVPLATGTWTVTYLCPLGSNYGISVVTLDGMILLTADQYTAGANNSGAVVAITGVTVAEGLHTLRLAKTGTKNASSTEFYCGIASITLRRLG